MKIFFTGKSNTPGPSGIKAGIYQTSCGHLFQTDHSIVDRTRSDCLIIYCVRGKGDFTLNSNKIDIEAGQMCAMPAKFQHSYNSDRNIGWEIYWIHFDGELADKLIKWAGFDQSNFKINCGINRELIDLFRQTLEITCRHDNLLLDIFFPGIIYSIFGQVKASVLRLQGSISLDSFEKLLENANFNLTVEQMSRKAGLSKYHFIREFKRKTGLTPGQYLISKKITVAKELLINSSLSIKQIAYKLNFNDSNYFSRLFKDKTGFSARHFRKTMSQY